MTRRCAARWKNCRHAGSCRYNARPPGLSTRSSSHSVRRCAPKWWAAANTITRSTELAAQGNLVAAAGESPVDLDPEHTLPLGERGDRVGRDVGADDGLVGAELSPEHARDPALAAADLQDRARVDEAAARAHRVSRGRPVPRSSSGRSRATTRRPATREDRRSRTTSRAARVRLDRLHPSRRAQEVMTAP